MLLLGIIFVVGLANIYLMIPTFFIGLIFYYIRRIYLPTARRVKRLEGVSKHNDLFMFIVDTLL
jgi:ATP-binding cassette subfamily C (CFTR/MRP) protein 4